MKIILIYIILLCLCLTNLYAKDNISNNKGNIMKIKHGYNINGQSSFDGEITDFDCKTDLQTSGSVTHRYDSVYSAEQVNLEYKQVIKIENFTGQIKYYTNTWSEEFTPKTWHPSDGPLTLSGLGRTTYLFYPYLFIENKGAYCAYNLVPTGDWQIDVTLEGTELNITAHKNNYISANGKYIGCDEIFTVEGTDKNQVYMDQQNHVREKYWHGGKVPLSYNTWVDRFANLDWDNLIKQIDFQAELGTEVFIVDAGWYGRFGTWEDIGQWEEKENLFKNGKTLSDLADYVRSKGMKFGIWMEVSKVQYTSDSRVNHPEFFVKVENFDDWSVPFCHYDFNNPKAMDYMYKEVCRIIDKYGAEWLKIDNGSQRLPAKGDPHVNGAYEYWKFMDRLKKTYPNLIIENTGAGASTNDLETISHYHTNGQTDTVYSLDLLKMMSESFKVYPPCFANNWACLHPTFNAYSIANKPVRNTTGMVFNPKDALCVGMEVLPINYVMATAFAGNFSMTGNFAELSDTDKETVKKLVKIYKDNKEFIMNANYLQLECDRGLAFILTDNDYKNILLFIFENCNEPWLWAKNVKTDLSFISKGKYDCVNLLTGEKEEIESVYEKPFEYREVKIFKLTKVDN